MPIMPISSRMTNVNFGNRNAVKVIKNMSTKQTQPMGKPVIVLASVVVAGQGLIDGVKNTVNSNNFAIKELTQEECDKKRDEIVRVHDDAHDEWLRMKEYYDKNDINYDKYNFPTFAFIDTDKLTPWNVQLLDYMLKNPETYKYNYNDLAEDIVELGNESFYIPHR